MKITETNIKENIIPEYEDWKEQMYAGKSKEERQKMGQFFTPPELTVKMIEKFTKLDGKCLDPCCGAGNLLIGMIFAKFEYYNGGWDKGEWNKTFQDCLNEIYGVEIDPEILKVCHERIKRLCKFVKDKYGFNANFNPYHFQLGDALKDNLSDALFWAKSPFEQSLEK